MVLTVVGEASRVAAAAAVATHSAAEAVLCPRLSVAAVAPGVEGAAAWGWAAVAASAPVALQQDTTHVNASHMSTKSGPDL